MPNTADQKQHAQQAANDRGLAYLVLYSREYEKDPTLTPDKFRALLVSEFGAHVKKAKALHAAKEKK